MRLSAPIAVRMPEGKYGSARAKVIQMMPFFSLALSMSCRRLAFRISFSAVLRKKKRISRKLITTPVVSASQETVMPRGRPKIRPLAVDKNIDGKMLPALMSTSIKKLMKMAQGPKERRYSASALTLPLTASRNALCKKSPANTWRHSSNNSSSASATIFVIPSGS